MLTAVIYPIQGSWSWGGGWLGEMGFSDFAGSTVVHSVGDWAALVGALILGPRRGKHGAGCRINPMPGANLPLATLGTFILWFGWFGFNGGSQLAMGSAAVGAFVSATAAITWLILKATIGIRASEEDKASGLDQAGLGLEAYPEFRRGSQTV